MILNLAATRTIDATLVSDDIEVTVTKVIDLTRNYVVVRGASKPTVHEGAWGWALLNAPETLTLKAKLRIFDNLFNQRSPFAGVGRIPNVALTAYEAAHAPKITVNLSKD